MTEYSPIQRDETLKPFTVHPDLPLSDQLEAAKKLSSNNGNVWVEANLPSGAFVGMIDANTDLNQIGMEFEERRNNPQIQSLIAKTALSE